ncbi:hypothetical protein CLV43_112320 [Umezawaea tangerina]|uniref:Uncharacterized protein n=1 Tax=Umezawaea tangerina TaxID=84725 RepID=A0A2T0SSK5_9PSEU|nr:hypothetical protein CLV43_112320 [Umezawaea tangerina]
MVVRSLRGPQGTELDDVQRAVVQACRDLPQTSDPLEVELTLSSAVPPGVADEKFWVGLIDHALSLPSRRNLALLRAMAVLLTGRPREWAMVVAPPVADSLRVRSSWICDRSLDAGYLALLCTYAHGVDEHAMVFLIDEVAGGVIRNAFVTRDVVVATERMAGQGTLESINPEAAHWLLAKSYDRLDRWPALTVDPEVHRTRLVANRRIVLAFG